MSFHLLTGSLWYGRTPRNSQVTVPELRLFFQLLNLLLIVCSQQGNSLNLYYATDVVFKGTFTIIVVSTCVYEWNCRVLRKQVATGLTRKLTKLAPKLIRGLWFLKQKIKSRWHVRLRELLSEQVTYLVALKQFMGGVKWQKCVKPVSCSTHWTDSLWRHGQGEAQDDCWNKRSYLSQKECSRFNAFTLPNTLQYVRILGHLQITCSKQITRLTANCCYTIDIYTLTHSHCTLKTRGGYWQEPHDTIHITIRYVSQYCDINKDENTCTCICTSDDIDQEDKLSQNYFIQNSLPIFLIPMKFPGSNILCPARCSCYLS